MCPGRVGHHDGQVDAAQKAKRVTIHPPPCSPDLQQAQDTAEGVLVGDLCTRQELRGFEIRRTYAEWSDMAMGWRKITAHFDGSFMAQLQMLLPANMVSPVPAKLHMLQLWA